MLSLMLLASIALNCPCSHNIGKTELLSEILFILFTFHFVTKQRLALKPLNVAGRAPDFGGITRRKQTADCVLTPHPCESTVFARVEIGLARLTSGTKKNAKFLNRLLKKNG